MFACYVSKVFLEEEDSCECRATGEGGGLSWASLLLQHPGQGSEPAVVEVAKGPLVEGGRGSRGGGSLHNSPFGAKAPMSRP